MRVVLLSGTAVAKQGEVRLTQMNRQIVARWEDWSGVGREHLVLQKGPDAIVADSVIITELDGDTIAVRYRIECDEHGLVVTYPGLFRRTK